MTATDNTHYYTALPCVLTQLSHVDLHTYKTHLCVQSSFPFMCHFPMSVMLTDSTHSGSCHVYLKDIAVCTAKLSLSVTHIPIAVTLTDSAHLDCCSVHVTLRTHRTHLCVQPSLPFLRHTSPQLCGVSPGWNLGSFTLPATGEQRTLGELGTGRPNQQWQNNLSVEQHTLGELGTGRPNQQLQNNLSVEQHTQGELGTGRPNQQWQNNLSVEQNPLGELGTGETHPTVAK